MRSQRRHNRSKQKLHGIVANDSYRWLEDEKNPKTQKWVRAQNKFSRSLLSKLPLRKSIARRLGQLLRINTIGVPYPKKNRYFAWERKKNQELGALYMQDSLGSEKRLLIDQNKLSKNKTATVGQWSVSEDGEFLAYTISESSNDQQSIHVLNVSTGKKLTDSIPHDLYPALHSSIAWNPDSSGFWYTRRWGKVPKNEEKLYQKLYYHRLGDNWRNDIFVFGKNIQKEAILDPQASIDGNYLIVSNWISAGKTRRNDIYIKNLKRRGKFSPVTKDVEAIFTAWPHRDMLYILTNYKASNWKLAAVPLSQATRGMKHWRTIIPEGKFPIEHVKSVRGRLFVATLENVHHVLRAYDLNGNYISEIKLPTFGTATGLSGEEEGNEIFFGFTSFLMPFRVYRFDLDRHRLELLNELKTKVNPNKFAVQQVWYRSKDETRVPMFLIHKKGIRKNVKNPALIYGYGGFGASILPRFQATIIPFLELGGIYAIANIRGGGEFGEKWHNGGIRHKKQNTFNDFIGAAEWLIKNKYTDSHHLAAFGWSNGGLLVGAITTQRPDLFRAVVAGAPVMDMLRFHKFHGGVHWISDYGNPDDPRDFKYLLEYSPYHNTKDGEEYPATLVLTAEGDDRVHPMHAYKFIARLTEANVSHNPVLLRVEPKAGHSGGIAVSKVIEEYADIYSFLSWQLKMNERRLF